MKNKIPDLNNHLFAQIERLGDESLDGEDLVLEIKRAQAMTAVSSQVVALGRLVLDAGIASRKFELPHNPVEQLAGPSKEASEK